MLYIADLPDNKIVDLLYDFIKESKPMMKTQIIEEFSLNCGWHRTLGIKIYVERRLRKAFQTLMDRGSIIYEPRKLVLFNLNHVECIQGTLFLIKGRKYIISHITLLARVYLEGMDYNYGYFRFKLINRPVSYPTLRRDYV